MPRRRTARRTPADRLVVALDVTAPAEAVRIAKRLRGLVRYLKVGSVLFAAAGPAVIRQIRALGFEVFLDLKFHDIPSTVEQSCRAVVRHRVAMLTIHASGSVDMLEAAAAGVRREASRLRVARPEVLGVTVLTSVGSPQAPSLRRHVQDLAVRARQAGLDGVVASAWEAPAIRKRLRLGMRRQAGRHAFAVVCPGIRPAGTRVSDHHRVVSPGEAIARGADLLVVGRPITKARDPRAAVRRILCEIEEADGRVSRRGHA